MEWLRPGGLAFSTGMASICIWVIWMIGNRLGRVSAHLRETGASRWTAIWTWALIGLFLALPAFMILALALIYYAVLTS